ncbi:mitochondrial glycine transporter-like isoform X2 [Hylaeus volcanicus]|uniref:mitochondrial glycine transporter-like isoform X2 n=1 Tax=Hylaeus volcanicus TaxID=313075 RepID=UPI0023B86C64|nr:mitochondrial glycine transporter-like isoform X2 [Hylaeus volcanicus]
MLERFYSTPYSPWLVWMGIGFLRGLIRCPLEQPFDAIKTKWQANPLAYKSLEEIVTNMYKDGGWRMFYRGSLPNTIRYPLLLLMPDLYSSTTEQVTSECMLLSKHTFLYKTLCALILSSVEAFLTSPLERIKTLLITRSNTSRSSLYYLFRRSSPQYSLFQQSMSSSLQFRHTLNRIRYIMSGFTPLWARQFVSWVTYLLTDAQCKSFLRHITQTTQLNFISLTLTACIVGIVNTLITMPFDAIKTHRQKFIQKNNVKMSTYFQSDIVSIWKIYGLKGFYVGFGLRLCQYFLNAIITVPLLDYLEMQKMTFQ